jgi:hypothetical protein
MTLVPVNGCQFSGSFRWQPRSNAALVKAFDLDDAKSRFLVLETGYITASGAPPENRLVEAATSNFPLNAGSSIRTGTGSIWTGKMVFSRGAIGATGCRPHFCDPLLSFHPVCGRRALLREPVQKAEHNIFVCGVLILRRQTHRRARQQHEQTSEPAGEFGGVGPLSLFLRREAMNLKSVLGPKLWPTPTTVEIESQPADFLRAPPRNDGYRRMSVSSSLCYSAQRQ